MMMAGQFNSGSSIAEVPLKVGADGDILPGQVGGERNTLSQSNNWDSIRAECNTSILASSAAAQNIGTGGVTPVFLMGVLINGVTTGTVTITGFTNPDGSTAAPWVIAAGTYVNAAILPPGNARRCESGCTVTCSVAADGPKVLIDWRPIS